MKKWKLSYNQLLPAQNVGTKKKKKCQLTLVNFSMNVKAARPF
jgi:hypothetical protein